MIEDLRDNDVFENKSYVKQETEGKPLHWCSRVAPLFNSTKQNAMLYCRLGSHGLSLSLLLNIQSFYSLPCVLLQQHRFLQTPRKSSLSLQMRKYPISTAGPETWGIRERIGPVSDTRLEIQGFMIRLEGVFSAWDREGTGWCKRLNDMPMSEGRL